MPHGTEVIFDLGYDVAVKIVHDYLDSTDPEVAAAELGIQDENDLAWLKGDGRDDWTAMVMTANQVVQKRLEQAHLEIVQELLDPKARLHDDDGFASIRATTSEGPREFSTFSLEHFGDDTDDFDAMFVGVSILSRYFPVWLDWRETHGGSHLGFVLNPETNGMIDAARTALAKVIPEIAEAPVRSVLQWY